MYVPPRRFWEDRVVYRLAQFLVQGGERSVYVEEPQSISRILSGFVISNDRFAQRRRLNKKHHVHTWGQMLDQGKWVFLPLNLPNGSHWLSVLICKDEDGGRKTNETTVHIRVYNSSTNFRKDDEKVAKLVAQMCVMFGGFDKPDINFVDNTPAVQLEQGASRNWCAVHVLARAWQACTGQIGSKLTTDVVDTVYKYGLKQLLLKNPAICAKLSYWEKDNACLF